MSASMLGFLVYSVILWHTRKYRIVHQLIEVEFKDVHDAQIHNPYVRVGLSRHPYCPFRKNYQGTFKLIWFYTTWNEHIDMTTFAARWRGYTNRKMTAKPSLVCRSHRRFKSFCFAFGSNLTSVSGQNIILYQIKFKITNKVNLYIRNCIETSWVIWVIWLLDIIIGYCTSSANH